MPLSSRFLVRHRDREAIDRALCDLFSAEQEAWTLTIRPSPMGGAWSVEVFVPGRFWAFAVPPADQDAQSIVGLVRAALGLDPRAQGRHE